jgi:hypothetical protein
MMTRSFPVSGHFRITVAAPYPFGTNPNGASIGCRARSTYRDPNAECGFRPYKLRVGLKNGKAEQHYGYKNYLFHGVVLNLVFDNKTSDGFIDKQNAAQFFYLLNRQGSNNEAPLRRFAL